MDLVDGADLVDLVDLVDGVDAISSWQDCGISLMRISPRSFVLAVNVTDTIHAAYATHETQMGWACPWPGIGLVFRGLHRN